jgi:hypothetical protein
MVFDGHDRTFAFFKDTCTRGIYDNMKTAVDTVFAGKERAYDRRFLQMGGPERCVLLGAGETPVRRLRFRQQRARIAAWVRSSTAAPAAGALERSRSPAHRHPVLVAAIDPILVARDRLSEELARPPRQTGPESDARRYRPPPPDDGARRRRRGRAQPRCGDRRPGTVRQIEGPWGRRLV